MITKIAGRLNRIADDELRLQVGPLEYQVLIPEFVRRQIQGRLGEDIILFTTHYLEGNPMQGRMVPRLVGFMSEEELEFFELFCTVDKVGVRKAMKALVRPIREIADAIQRQDAKLLTTLPGVGPSTAEQVVASLRKKVTKFALGGTTPATPGGTPSAVDANIIEDAYQALLAVGHTALDARDRLDRALRRGKTFATVEEVLREVYSQ